MNGAKKIKQAGRLALTDFFIIEFGRYWPRNTDEQ